VTRFKLITELQRDIRNQVVIDQMKKLTAKGKLMVYLNWFNRPAAIAALVTAVLWILLCITIVHAQDAAKITCPVPGETCKVVFLNAQEEKILTGPNGILDTAAQGRAIDLGGFAVYFKQKIGSAPSGEVKPMPASPASDKPVDNPKK
jgi:hypothetical protein